MSEEMLADKVEELEELLRRITDIVNSDEYDNYEKVGKIIDEVLIDWN